MCRPTTKTRRNSSSQHTFQAIYNGDRSQWHTRCTRCSEQQQAVYKPRTFHSTSVYLLHCLVWVELGRRTFEIWFGCWIALGVGFCSSSERSSKRVRCQGLSPQLLATAVCTLIVKSQRWHVLHLCRWILGTKSIIRSARVTKRPTLREITYSKKIKKL